MATDIDYLDELMKSIEPVVYPDGDPDNLVDDSELDEMEFDEVQTPSDFAVQKPEEVVEEFDEEPMMVDISEIDLPEKGDRNIIREKNAEPASEPVDSIEQEPAVKESIKEPIGEEFEELALSEEEINAMLDFAKESGEAAATTVNENADVKDLLGMFDGDAQMQDIKNTLEKSDNNIAVDESALKEKEIEIPDFDSDDTAEDIEEKPKKAKKEKKPKKEKKAKEDSGEEEASSEEKEKKKGLFAKLFDKLTEEVPEEEATVSHDNLVSDENAKILSELDAEEDKKGKKKKKKKSKKEKVAPETEGTEKDIREKGEEETQTGKKKKEKRAKKEKAQEENQRPVKKLPKKRVRNTFILCLSILAGIILLVFLMNDALNKKEAREAFNKKDYETAYADLYGLDLGEKDAEIYNKSATIMILQRKVDSYENYLRLGMRKEALNALVSGYRMYPDILESANKYGVTDEVNEVYAKLLDGISEYGLDVNIVDTLANMESQVEYNKAIIALAGGQSIPVTETNEENLEEDASQEQVPVIDDILPEEMDDYLPDSPEIIFE